MLQDTPFNLYKSYYSNKHAELQALNNWVYTVFAKTSETIGYQCDDDEARGAGGHIVRVPCPTLWDA